MTPAIANAPGLLRSVRLFTPPALPPRDPRFVRGPSELCQLAGVYSPTMAMHGQWACEEKHDGVRAIYADGRIVTREGNIIHAADHILPELQRLQTRYGSPAMLDGEYVAGTFLETMSALRSKRQGQGHIVLFDAVPLDQWRRDDCPLALFERQRLLRIALEDMGAKHLRMVEPVPMTNAAQVQAMAERVWASGGEGIMLKDQASLYRRKRSNSWQKHKRTLSLTGRVLEVLSDGAALRVEVEGRKVKVAAPPALRGRGWAVENVIRITAMEWTQAAQLRNACAVEIIG